MVIMLFTIPVFTQPPKVSITPELIDLTLRVGEASTQRIIVDIPPSPAVPVDIYFLVDTSGSFDDYIATFKEQAPDVISALRTTGLDVRFGLGRFEDYPISPFGDADYGDKAYERVIDITADISAVLSAISGLSTRFGGDGPESQLPALFQLTTGTGQDLSRVGCSGATIPSGQQANFRAGALPIVILWTDAPFHEPGDEMAGPDSCSPGLPYPGPSFTETMNVLNAKGIKVIGVVGENPKYPEFTAAAISDLKEIASGTSTFAPRGGIDCDGDGHIDIAAGDPLVCPISSTGAGIGEAIKATVGAITQTVTISIVSLDNPATSFDERTLVRSVNPPVYQDVDLGVANHLAFDVTFTCTEQAAGKTYEFTLEARANGGALGSVNVSLTCGGLPDLVIVGVRYDPREPKVGETMKFSVTVRNQGEGDAGAFSVQIEGAMGKDSRSISSLAAGASTTVELSLRLAAAIETFTITVDPANQVTESNEDNNIARVTVTAKPVDAPIKDLAALAQQPQQAREFAQQRLISIDPQNRVTITLKAESGKRIDRDTIRRLGGEIIVDAEDLLAVKAPLDKLLEVSQVTGVASTRPAYPPVILGESEGVGLVGASAYHNAGFKGQGIKIAVIDAGFAGLSQAKSKGDLPESAIDKGCSKDYTTDSDLEKGISHGTAVAEIVHDMAPEARLCLMKVGGKDMTSGVAALKRAVQDAIALGVKVINHSVGWPDTGFGDGQGEVAEIAKDALSKGVLWVNAAGNHAQVHYLGDFSDPDGDSWHNFSGADESITLQLGASQRVVIYLTWDEWPTTARDFDFYLFSEQAIPAKPRCSKAGPPLPQGLGSLVGCGDGGQSGTQAALEIFDTLGALPSGNYHLMVRAASPEAKGRVQIFIDGLDYSRPIEHRVEGGSLLPPADVSEVFTVGAIGWQNWGSPQIEVYSSRGPTNAGVAKPDISGPDCVSTSPPHVPYFHPFCGTSAAAPHVAGAAALLLSAGISPDQLKSELLKDVEKIPGGDPNIFGEGKLRLILGKPDLTVASVDYLPRTPQEVGVTLTFTVTIRNQGARDAGPFEAEIKDNAGSQRQSIGGLSAGASMQIGFDRRLNVDGETFTITVDPDNRVDEADETNNIYTVRIPLPVPVLEVSPSSLTLRGEEGGTNPSQPLTIRNGGGGVLNWNATKDADWLILSRTSGSLSTGETVTVKVEADITKLAVDTPYQGIITISAPGARGSPKTVTVTARKERTIAIEAFRVGKSVYQIGEGIQISFQINKDAYMYIYHTNAVGRQVRVFPNEYSPNNFITTRGLYILPDRDYKLLVGGPEGSNLLCAIASEQRLDLSMLDRQVQCQEGRPLLPLSVVPTGKAEARTSFQAILPDVAGFFISPTLDNKLRLTIQGHSSWSSSHGFRMVLETDGTFTSAQADGNEPWWVATTPSNVKEFTGSVRNGRINFTIGISSNATIIKSDLQLDMDGDGRLEQRPEFVALLSGLMEPKRPLFNPFGIRFSLGQLLPFRIEVCEANFTGCRRLEDLPTVGWWQW